MGYQVRAEDMDAKGDGDVLVILDLRRDESFHGVGVAREIVNRIQKLRNSKKVSLEPTDMVEVFFKSLDKDEKVSQEIIESQQGYIREALGSSLRPSSLIPPHAVILGQSFANSAVRRFTQEGVSDLFAPRLRFSSLLTPNARGISTTA